MRDAGMEGRGHGCDGRRQARGVEGNGREWLREGMGVRTI